MDINMDKIADRLNAQEIIDANMAADAKELERLENQLKEYDRCLEQAVSILQKSAQDCLSKSNEHVHKESVKVYRNVQAVIMDESVKQTALLKQLMDSVAQLQQITTEKKPTPGIVKGILWLSILSMLLSAGALAFQILLYLQII